MPQSKQDDILGQKRRCRYPIGWRHHG